MFTTTAFKTDLQSLLNAHSMENASGTPDFILAEYLFACLRAFEAASNDRSAWRGPSGSVSAPATAPRDAEPEAEPGRYKAEVWSNIEDAPDPRMGYKVPPYATPAGQTKGAGWVIGETSQWVVGSPIPRGWRWLVHAPNDPPLAMSAPRMAWAVYTGN